jgi:aldehyde dehydrogenase (NAD+)
MTSQTDIQLRKKVLIHLLHELNIQEDAIVKALYADFKKPPFEAIITETSFVKSELKNTIKNINTWAKPKMVLPSILNFPSIDYIYKEPYGKVLIIAPWNYPFQLALCPLIAAFAAGNQVVLKPSELTPHTSKIIATIITTVFDTNQIEVVEGDISKSQELLSKRWDYIFFTGSVTVGKVVAQAAAQFLTPVTLELGGKSPCIVDETASLKLAAKRIVWGKFLNAGQTCIAPDYLVVHSKIKAQFIEFLKEEITIAYGVTPESSPDFARIVNAKNWERLTQLLVGTRIICGGASNKKDHYIAPTLVDEPSLESPIMSEEIFGPLLPILTFNDEKELSEILVKFEKPLSFYVFSTSSTFIKNCIQNYSFGGGCINDIAIHFANKRLPFGGVGHSGIGSYHGQRSFDTFSHQKAIVRKGNWLDVPLRYAPYKNKLAYVRKLLDWF